jgi:hypothetical protein
MKRRNFLKNSLGIAGLLGLGASSSLMNTAMAKDLTEAGVSVADANLELTLQTTAESFKHKGHQVKILRREFRHRSGKNRGKREERWVMTLNGRELPKSHFSRQDSKGCYSSDLLPFSDECSPRTLATALVDGHEMQLFDLQ